MYVLPLTKGYQAHNALTTRDSETPAWKNTASRDGRHVCPPSSAQAPLLPLPLEFHTHPRIVLPLELLLLPPDVIL